MHRPRPPGTGEVLHSWVQSASSSRRHDGVPVKRVPEHGIRTHACAHLLVSGPAAEHDRRPRPAHPDHPATVQIRVGTVWLRTRRGRAFLQRFPFLSGSPGLHYIARFITGKDIDTEPRLFLWGLELTDDSLQPWDLLIAARQRFESRLPVKRPATEPDIALFQPGQFLILCEAKFCSDNPVYRRRPPEGQAIAHESGAGRDLRRPGPRDHRPREGRSSRLHPVSALIAIFNLPSTWPAWTARRRCHTWRT